MSSIGTNIDVPSDFLTILADADEITRNRIYVRLKQINIPNTDPKQMDRLIRTLAAICQI